MRDIFISFSYVVVRETMAWGLLSSGRLSLVGHLCLGDLLYEGIYGDIILSNVASRGP